jgi:hypothetical protein
MPTMWLGDNKVVQVTWIFKKGSEWATAQLNPYCA